MKVYLEIPLSEKDEKLVRDAILNYPMRAINTSRALRKAGEYVDKAYKFEAKNGHLLTTDEAARLKRWIAVAIRDLLNEYSMSFEEMKKILDNYRN